MADIMRTGSASWSGDLREGKGTTSTGGVGLKTDSGFKVSKIHLQTEGQVPGLGEAAFREAAKKQKRTVLSQCF